MQVKFKSLLLCSAILSYGIMSNISDAAGWNNNNNWGQNFNNNVMKNNNMQNNTAPAQLTNNNFNKNMQWNRNNNWNNNQMNFNNNFAMQNNVQQYLINKTLNNKDKIATNWQNVNKYDWQLFKQNITQSPSAKTSAIRALRSLFVGDGAQNFNSQNESERTIRLECANCIGGLINFYAGDYNNALKESLVKSSEFELLTLIANYYITNLASGYNISLVQNNLRSFNNLPMLLNTLGYQSYYQQYFMPRYSNTIRQSNGQVFINPFLPNAITWQDWNKAVTIAQNIDLAGSLKKLIKGINIANYFENNRKYSKQTNNSQVVLSNGDGKCAFNTMFQLLSSGLQKMKDANTVSPITTGYFADFDMYLRKKQSSNGEPLLLIDELWNFEETLSKDALEIWNSDKKVLQAKNKLREMQHIFSNEAWMTALDLFSRIFPELRELYDENYYLNSFMENNNCNSEQFYKIDPSRNYLFFSGSGNSGFGDIDKGIKRNILFNNINTNQYMIWFDKQGNVSLYELTGLQLSAPGHNVAYAKYDNSAFNWRVVNSAGESSNYGMQLGGIFQDVRFQNLKAVGGVGAYMFKKVSSQEFVQYMPQGLIL